MTFPKLLNRLKTIGKELCFKHLNSECTNSGIMHKTFREFNGKTFLLDEFSYFGISKAEAEKRKAMWKKSGLNARCVKKANGKYVVYREYPDAISEEDGSSLFHVG